jgi:hypothetical protein
VLDIACSWHGDKIPIQDLSCLSVPSWLMLWANREVRQLVIESVGLTCMGLGKLGVTDPTSAVTATSVNMVNVVSVSAAVNRLQSLP